MLKVPRRRIFTLIVDCLQTPVVVHYICRHENYAKQKKSPLFIMFRNYTNNPLMVGTPLFNHNTVQ